jgi:hypothetical protein
MVVEFLSPEIEDLPTDYLANMEALAVEYVSVHGWPPLSWSSLDKLRQPIVNSEGFTRIATRLAGGTVSALAGRATSAMKPPAHVTARAWRTTGAGV